MKTAFIPRIIAVLLLVREAFPFIKTNMSKKSKATKQVRTAPVEVMPSEKFEDQPTLANINRWSDRQIALFELAKEVRVAERDTLDKCRKAILFIKENHIHLHGTENQVMIAAGFHKMQASQFKKIALDSSPEILRQYLAGDVGFRLALEDARTPKTPENPARIEVELPEEMEGEEDETKAEYETEYRKGYADAGVGKLYNKLNSEPWLAGYDRYVEDQAAAPDQDELELKKAEASLQAGIELAVRRLEALNQLDHDHVDPVTKLPTNNYTYHYNKFTVSFVVDSTEASRTDLQKLGAIAKK